MKKTLEARKLALTTTTVRLLTTRALRDVGGGTIMYPYPDATLSCNGDCTLDCAPGESNNACGPSYKG